MIAGSLGKIIDYMIIGLACWKVGGVFSKNARLTTHLGERIATRTVTPLSENLLHRHGLPMTRYQVAIEAAGGSRQETFYDFYARPRSNARNGAPRILMLYHHGMGELPHDYTFHNLFFGSDPMVGADLVALKATYHPPHLIPTPDSAYLADAACWIEMMADSVALAGHIARRHRQDYDGVFLGGISLGGIIALAALAYDDCFDLYHPMMVGPNLPEQLRMSLFMHFTRADVVASLEHDRELEALNFLPAVEQHASRVHLIVGEHDPVFRIAPIRLLAERLPELRLEVLPHAHITGCLAGEPIRVALFRRWRDWATGPRDRFKLQPAGAGPTMDAVGRSAPAAVSPVRSEGQP
ncbi:MAG TPA: hypothetical protein VL860_07090 [Planctomycetota bacterium]|nr:hypothetical protein [Planctomycetota bacterium]